MIKNSNFDCSYTQTSPKSQPQLSESAPTHDKLPSSVNVPVPNIEKTDLDHNLSSHKSLKFATSQERSVNMNDSSRESVNNETPIVLYKNS